jgi:dTDP-4-dehydrorhamnose reductase
VKTLLLGTVGQIGWELERMLPVLGEVVGVDLPDIDLTSPDSVRDAIQGCRPELIVNAAAYTAVDEAEQDEATAMAVNAAALEVIGDLAARTGAAVVHFSTDYVFDGSKPGPYLPDDPPDPINAYGRSKLAGERALLASGAACLILRTSWVYGLRGSNFLLTMLRLAKTQDTLRVVDDQIGCPSWSRRIARGTVSILSRALGGARGERHFDGHEGVYHLTATGAASWCDFASAILEAADLDRRPEVRPIPASEYPTPAKRPTNSVLECSLTQGTFGVSLGDWRIAVPEALGDRPVAASAVEVGVGV